MKNVLRGWKWAVSNSKASCWERAQQMECLFLMLSGGQPEGGRAEEIFIRSEGFEMSAQVEQFGGQTWRNNMVWAEEQKRWSKMYCKHVPKI